MSKSKKITYKELMERLNFVLGKMMQFERALDYNHTLVLKYIEFKGDVKKLRDFLKKEDKNNEQTNGSSPKADRDHHERNPETQRKVEKIRKDMDARKSTQNSLKT